MKIVRSVSFGAVVVLAAAWAAMGHQKSVPWQDVFPLEDCALAASGANPYFLLEPGYRLVLEGKEGRKAIRLEITVLFETKKIGPVETRVVEERESADGQLTEVSRNYFAICPRTKDIYYFGEDVDVYKGGKIVDHDGAWLAFEGKNRAGLLLPGAPRIGQRHYQEVAPGTAMDRAEVVSLSETLRTPAGEFKNCLKVEETTPLEPGSREFKIYAPGVGLIQDAELLLTQINRLKSR